MFAKFEKIIPGAGQESVWDYPRPPRLEKTAKHVQVHFHGKLIADTHQAQRILETSHPPNYYIPPEDIKKEFFKEARGTSFCEWKGQAKYYTIDDGAGHVAQKAAWYYPEPVSRYEAIKDHVAFYPSQFDCTVDGEKVKPQEGGFYGGWITSDIVGPFKGSPGTMGW
jgi:uncharacterized protein (DUF427 family)